MTYTERHLTIKQIKQDEPGFYITDGMILTGRAGLMINADCPSDIAFAIRQAMSKKWITMVSHVKDSELMWEQLGE